MGEQAIDLGMMELLVELGVQPGLQDTANNYILRKGPEAVKIGGEIRRVVEE